MPKFLFLCLFIFLLTCPTETRAQAEEEIPLISLHMPDTLHKQRFWVSASAGAVIYGGFSVALWNSWYRNYELSPFHFFDDRGEWENMDKVGHAFTAYNEARWLFNGARWTGMQRRKSTWTAAVIAFGLQGTIEVMDGFSDKWGFSVPDVAMNTAGIALFVGQEYLWEEQRLIMKVSSQRVDYPDARIYSRDGAEFVTHQERADNLYGTTFAQRYLKDYNGQTLWLSANIHSFLPNRKTSKFPEWLNVAVGYGAENMYAGYGYAFSDDDGNNYVADRTLYPRYNQGYLSLDIDFTRIPTKKRWLQTVFGVINFIKVPLPALEYSKPYGFKFHAFR